jgi:hypothetical protein
MGHITIGEHHLKPHNLVAEIEGIIHDHHRFDAFVHEARTSLRQTGLLPHNPIWEYLHWRRELDPPRFDHYHPGMVRLFRWEQRDIEQMRHRQPTPGAIVEFPIIPGTLASAAQPPENLPRVVASVVPEPGTPTLGLVAIAVGAASVAAGARRSGPGR